MPIQVDYYDKVVYITSPTTTVTVQELVDAIRAAEDTPEGMAFGGSVATLVDAVTDAEGKASVGGGFLAGIVMTLKSDWYIEFWDGVVLGTVSGGNVTGGLANRPVRCAVGSSDTALQLGAVGGVIAETGTSGLTSEESTELFSIKSSIKGADDDDLKDISDQLDVVQADLDNPNQYKADVSGLAPAGEYDAELAAIQADLDNPNQYKADVSALALETTAQAIKGKTDNLPTDPADQSAVEAAITTAESNIRGADSDDLKTLSDQLDVAQADLDNPDQYKADISGLAPAGEYDAELAAIQADLDDPDQYKADLTSVALEATLQLVKTETDKIPSLESLLAFISSIEGGRWRIVNNQMIFYEDDNVTEVARFNLFDSDGQPAETDVFERVRV